MKILFHYPPVPPYSKSFLTKIKASKCPVKEKKMAQEKQKKTGGERKVKSGDLCILKLGKLKFFIWKR